MQSKASRAYWAACRRAGELIARFESTLGDHSYLGDAISPVVVRYESLGVTMSQTVSLAAPALVVLPYRSCT